MFFDRDGEDLNPSSVPVHPHILRRISPAFKKMQPTLQGNPITLFRGHPDVLKADENTLIPKGLITFSYRSFPLVRLQIMVALDSSHHIEFL